MPITIAKSGSHLFPQPKGLQGGIERIATGRGTVRQARKNYLMDASVVTDSDPKGARIRAEVVGQTISYLQGRRQPDEQIGGVMILVGVVGVSEGGVWSSDG